ncbi:hypothetical protein GIB67_022827 [Kingdonia uniflora]|uniref:Transposase n=1 Tax=Kingdonia uniflora TaxID=39325 RepID=A0A7J7P6T3_9MAGN|nr:hypothetical protein GIB67_022827 [Kingdonia uniflora]
MTPGTTRRHLRAQSTSQLVVNTRNDSSVASCKRKRGKAVNNKVIDYKAITGHDWSKVEDDVRGPLCNRVMDKFDIDMHLPYVKYMVDKILEERLRGFRCILNSHYKKFENDGVARRYPYGGQAQEKWVACCDWFRREEFKNISDQNSSNRQKLPTNYCGGSKPFVKYLEESRDSETQQPVGMIELYCRTHFSSKGWTSLVAEENYLNELEAKGAMPKIEGEILNTVLGVRSRYSKGLGHGVIPQSSKRVSSIQLEEEVQRRRDEEEFQRRMAEEAEKRNEELKAEMVS